MSISSWKQSKFDSPLPVAHVFLFLVLFFILYSMAKSIYKSYSIFDLIHQSQERNGGIFSLNMDLQKSHFFALFGLGYFKSFEWKNFFTYWQMYACGIKGFHGLRTLTHSIFNLLFEFLKAKLKKKPFKNWTPQILPKSFTHQHNIKLFW